MGFNPGVTDVSLGATPSALNIPQASPSTNPAASGLEKLNLAPQGSDVTDPEAFGAALINQNTGLVTPLDGNNFFTTDPGEYELGLSAVDGLGVVLSYQLQTARVVKTFRRYIVPSDCLVIDLDKPWEPEVDIWGFPTGRVRVHVLNGGAEPVRLEILHPENEPLNRSDVYLNVGYPTGVEIITNKISDDVTEWSFDANPAAIGWETYIANGKTYRYRDYVFSSVSVFFRETEDKRILSPLGTGPVVFRVWDQYLPTAVPARMAPCDDNTLLDLLTQASRGSAFSGTVRLRGAIGDITGMPDGYQINLAAAQVGTFRSFTIDSWDDYSSVNFGISPVAVPQVQMQESKTFSIPIGSAADGDRTKSGLLGTNPWDKRPRAVYNWMVLDLSARFQLVILPLAIDPVDIPVHPGFPSLVPLQFFIHDRGAPGQQTDCPVPLTFNFTGAQTAYRIVLPGSSLDAGVNGPVRIFESNSANPLECSFVYTIWIGIPDDDAHPDETLLVNGEPFVTFSTKAMDLDPSQANRDAFFGDVNKFIALGNFMHLFDVENPVGNSLERCCTLATSFSTFFMSVGNHENIRHGGYQFANDASFVHQMVYWLGQSNWVGCVQEDWLGRAQAFLDERGWGSGTFLDFLTSGSAYETATRRGIDIGLPFGTATSHFSGSGAFDLDRNKVSVILLVNFFVGVTISYPYVMDWNGDWRVIWDRLYSPVDKDDIPLNKPDGTPWTKAEWDQALEVNGPAGLWLYRIMETNGPLYAWDVYWLDYAVNTRKQAGFRADGFNATPFLLNPVYLACYDPTANPPIGVVSSDDFSYAGSYAANETLPLDVADYVPEHVSNISSVQIYVADAKYAGPGGGTDAEGNPLPRGMQKLDWSVRYQWDFQDLHDGTVDPTRTA
ncbi:MAG: hypothetical protein P1V51_20070 [Deltaproteobacteria bacterium]|nr:hypothetical protein [Deltaproteobacteria bacterium]